MASEFPASVYRFFDAKGTRNLVTPTFLQGILGVSEIYIPEHDIYVMGKERGDKSKRFWTKMRIRSKASERNMLQGLLGVEFLAGHGKLKVDSEYKENGCRGSEKNAESNTNAESSRFHIMRPITIRSIVTEDGASFKKRSVIHLKDDVFVILEDAESFCRIPLMDQELLDKHEKRSNSKKRDAYARKKVAGNKWAHVNRDCMLREQLKRMHKMILPYKRNLSDDAYFSEFTKDILTNCMHLHKDFSSDSDSSLQFLKRSLSNIESEECNDESESVSPRRKKSKCGTVSNLADNSSIESKSEVNVQIENTSKTTESWSKINLPTVCTNSEERVQVVIPRELGRVSVDNFKW